MNKSKRDIAHLERSKSYSCASAVTIMFPSMDWQKMDEAFKEVVIGNT